MNNLQQVVQRAKADLAKGYVFVHMKGPQLETLLAGLEEAQRENAAMKVALESAADTIRHMKNDYPNEMWTHQEQERWERFADDEIANILSTLSTKEMVE